MLTFIAYYEDGQGHSLVISALEALNDGGSCYEFWFKSLEQALSGRGKMGSLVGASEEVRRAGMDSSLNEYAVCLFHVKCQKCHLTGHPNS